MRRRISYSIAYFKKFFRRVSLQKKSFLVQILPLSSWIYENENFPKTTRLLRFFALQKSTKRCHFSLF